MADETPTPTPTLPAELPVLPLRRTVAFPLTLQPLAVNRPTSVESVNAGLASDRLLLLVLQKGDDEDPGPEALETFGTVGIIRQMARADRGLNIIECIDGISNFRWHDLQTTSSSTRMRWSRTLVNFARSPSSAPGGNRSFLVRRTHRTW